jgi:hypothetical protein
VSNTHREYIGEIHHNFRIVVISDLDSLTGRTEHVGRLGFRMDLAPALPDRFDWSAVGNPLAGERLALALLADALRELVLGDELAVRLAPQMLDNTVRQFAGDGFRIGATAIARWAVEQVCPAGEVIRPDAGSNRTPSLASRGKRRTA